MKLGRGLELRLEQTSDGSWMYEIKSGPFTLHYGYRPTENAARNAGLEDGGLLVAFHSAPRTADGH